MSEEAVAFVLQSDQLRMDEADILEKVTEWATVNSVSWRRGRGRRGEGEQHSITLAE